MADKINKYKIKMLNILNSCGITENLFARCIGIYFILSAVHILEAWRNGIYALDMWQIFIQVYPLKTTLIWLVIYFVLVSLLFYYIGTKSKPVSELIDPVLLIFGTVFFSCAMLWKKDDWENENFYLCISVCVTAVVFIIYGISKLKEKYIENISSKIIAIITALISVFILVFLLMTTIPRHKIFNTSCWDLGLFTQMYYNLTHHLKAVTTCERDILLSHFDVHASYIFYLLVPFYALFPGPETLIVVQDVLTISGIIPLFLIAKNRNFKGIGLLSACMVYLFSCGLLTTCYYYFHENAFLPPLLLWLLYAVEKRKYPLFFIMSFLVCMVKEDAPLYVICIALYLAIEEKNKDRFHAIIVTIVSAAYFLFITNWLTRTGDGSTTMYMATRFGNLAAEQNDGFISIIKNILSNPGYFFSLFVQEDTILFFIEMLLPLAFLPFATKKIHRFLLIIPFILMNLIQGSNYILAALMGYQYTSGPSALLIYLAIINISDFKKDIRNICIITAGALSIITVFSMISGKILYYEHYIEYKDFYANIEAGLDTIPDDASVISSRYILPHLAERDEIYLFDAKDYIIAGDEVIGLKDLTKYDFYVLDYSEEDIYMAIPYLKAAGYKVFAEYENAIVIYVSPTYTFNP